MAIQKINLGSSPKGEGGDKWREGGNKINANFNDLDERTTLAQETANSKTANATDAHLLSRSNHTGTQPISTISGLQAALDSAVSGGGGGSASYADTAGKLASPVQIHGVNFDGSTGINIPNFTATKSGVVPATGSGTTKYLRSDGTWAIPTDTTYTVFGVSPGLVPAKVGSTTTKFLREDGTWVIPTDTNTTYSTMTATDANAGTATTGQVITAAVLKSAILTHAPTSGGVSFAAKVGLELEIVFDFVSGSYYTSSNILSVSNQTNIASAVIDSNGILCLTFNTPISNPNLIVTTKGEVKNVTYNGMDYKYLTSPNSSGLLGNPSAAVSLYNIIQDAEKGYVNTSTKLYISCNLILRQDHNTSTGEILSTYSLESAFPAKFNIGIIDA